MTDQSATELKKSKWEFWGVVISVVTGMAVVLGMGTTILMDVGAMRRDFNEALQFQTDHKKDHSDLTQQLNALKLSNEQLMARSTKTEADLQAFQDLLKPFITPDRIERRGKAAAAAFNALERAEKLEERIRDLERDQRSRE